MRRRQTSGAESASKVTVGVSRPEDQARGGGTQAPASWLRSAVPDQPAGSCVADHAPERWPTLRPPVPRRRPDLARATTWPASRLMCERGTSRPRNAFGILPRPSPGPWLPARAFAAAARPAPTLDVTLGGDARHRCGHMASDSSTTPLLTAASDDDEGVAFGDDVESRQANARLMTRVVTLSRPSSRCRGFPGMAVR